MIHYGFSVSPSENRRSGNKVDVGVINEDKQQNVVHEHHCHATRLLQKEFQHIIQALQGVCKERVRRFKQQTVYQVLR